KSAYDELANDKKVIENYLISKGIAKNQMVFSAVDIQKQINYGTDANGRSTQTFGGYQLSQKVSIDSKDVAKVENLSRNITEIINLGIEFTSSPPSYFYTKLADVKQQMIADATKDAKQRAEKIAENSGAKLGNLKKATMGITQITAPNSTEEYSYGGTFNTSSKDKEASITIKLEYEVN
ncbi:MAG TPA: SIMPL domain-containing protein, partial [Kaistella chaponensis]|uniref:SIMPL domain-containing protein n=1 Tax=Kaistella chaponensis TaxID=713588 RepID=UPI002B52B720